MKTRCKNTIEQSEKIKIESLNGEVRQIPYSQQE
jgi:hypothetical protein